MRGRLFAIVGPSGVGKDTLIAGAVAGLPGLARARRSITRPPAESEDFESLSEEAFHTALAGGEFALFWPAHGLFYGIRKAEFAPLARGQDVIFNGSRQALAAAKATFADLRVIEITVSSQVLATRLAARGRESEAEIAARLSRAALPLPEGIEAVRIFNDTTPEAGIAALIAALQPESA